MVSRVPEDKQFTDEPIHLVHAVCSTEQKNTSSSCDAASCKQALKCVIYIHCNCTLSLVTLTNYLSYMFALSMPGPEQM